MSVNPSTIVASTIGDNRFVWQLVGQRVNGGTELQWSRMRHRLPPGQIRFAQRRT